MTALLLAAGIWVSLQQSDGSVIECTTTKPVEYHPSGRLIRIDDCGDEIFTNGFEG